MFTCTTLLSMHECPPNFVVFGLARLARKSRLNYEIMSQQGKGNVVHVNLLKRAYNPVEWQEPKKGKVGKRLRPKRRQPEEEEEQEVSSSGPILSREPLVENRQPELPSPFRDRQCVDTPTPGPSPREAPSNHRIDLIGHP